MSELKPCPFCGSKALTNIFLDYEDIENLPTNVIDDYEPEVTCENERCIYGWWLSPKDWNTRPIEDELRKRIAELEAEVTKYHELQDSYCDRIAELKAFINQLIEAGDAMSNAQSMWVAEEDNWDALVKDWKEREE